MHAGNVELIRSAFDAYERGDLDAILDVCDPDVVVVEPPDLPGGRAYRGRQGMRDALTAWPRQWDEWGIEIVRIATADDRAIVTTHQHGRGKESGIEVDAEFTFVFEIRHGKLTEWRMFSNEEDAVDAAGLRA